MIDATKVYFFIFGVLTIAGGVMGYVKAQSIPSLVAGGGLGLLLLVAGALIMNKATTPGLVLGLVVSIALAGRFAPIFLKSQQMMPAGLMSVLGVIGIVMAAIALLKK